MHGTVKTFLVIRLLYDVLYFKQANEKFPFCPSALMILLHIAWEFYSIKLICTNLYALFSHVEKAYTANQNGVQLFHMWKYNQPTIV